MGYRTKAQELQDQFVTTLRKKLTKSEAIIKEYERLLELAYAEGIQNTLEKSCSWENSFTKQRMERVKRGDFRKG